MSSSKTTTKATSPSPTRESRQDSINQVILIGRLVAAPELRQTAFGKHVTTVRVATNGKTHAEFHDVVLWNQLADFATGYLGKGRLVYIEGRLQSRQWEAQDRQHPPDHRDRGEPPQGAHREDRHPGGLTTAPMILEGGRRPPRGLARRMSA